MHKLVKRMRALRWLSSPVLLGLDNVPKRGPVLYVGNHNMFGVIDATMLVVELYERRGVSLRGLGDRVHFKLPVWRDLLRSYGVVEGTRDNCAELFEAGEHVLVFPGGAREVAKRKGEKYQLMWKQRVGFARMAIRHGVTIVPFSSIGVEDAFDILLDANDIIKSPAGGILERLGVRGDLLMPLASDQTWTWIRMPVLLGASTLLWMVLGLLLFARNQRKLSRIGPGR